MRRISKRARFRFPRRLPAALMGKEEGDVVAMRVPSGTVEYEIENVEHI